jgi:hypothetical protein
MQWQFPVQIVAGAVHRIVLAVNYLWQAGATAGVIVTPTFGAAVTIDNTLGDIQRVVANAATAPTIGAPASNGVDGQYLTIIIRNASGGAMGATTFNAAYHLAAAWVNPANLTERSITFRGNGAGVWYELYRNATDVTT